MFILRWGEALRWITNLTTSKCEMSIWLAALVEFISDQNSKCRVVSDVSGDPEEVCFSRARSKPSTKLYYSELCMYPDTRVRLPSRIRSSACAELFSFGFRVLVRGQASGKSAKSTLPCPVRNVAVLSRVYFVPQACSKSTNCVKIHALLLRYYCRK